MIETNTVYWINESNESYKTAVVLFENKRYLESAFFCHLAIEKILKSFIAYRKKSLPPKIHNLLNLADRSDLTTELTGEQLDFLAGLNLYQLEGRYPGIGKYYIHRLLLRNLKKF